MTRKLPYSCRGDGLMVNRDSTSQRRFQSSAAMVDLIPSPPMNLRDLAVLLDVDGTILDIAPTPHEVRVPPSLRSNLESLAQQSGGAVALVSGRSIADLDSIFAPLRLPAVGGHGAEIRLGAHGL